MRKAASGAGPVGTAWTGTSFAEKLASGSNTLFRAPVHIGLVIDCLCWFHHNLEMADPLKELVWIASSLKDLRSFPEEVMDVIGYALHQAQMGEKHEDAKPLKGYRGAGVLEVVDDYDGDTYRAVYTVKFDGYVYMLHAFQKKAKRGRATPQSELAVVKSRLKLAKADHNEKMKRKHDG